MALGLIASVVFGGISYFKLAKLPMHFSIYAFVMAVIAMIVVSQLIKLTSEKVLDKTITGWYIHKNFFVVKILFFLKQRCIYYPTIQKRNYLLPRIAFCACCDGIIVLFWSHASLLGP